MATQKELGQQIMQAILDHIRLCRRERRPAEPLLYPRGFLISYSSLIAASGVQLPARRMSGPLTEIGHLCKLRGWPPLPALVVKLDTGQPGGGYFRAQPHQQDKQATVDQLIRDWELEARECIEYKGWPVNAPAITQLEHQN